HVVALVAGEAVVAVATVETVVEVAAVEGVVAGSAPQRVVTAAAVDAVVAAAAFDGVVTGAAGHDVGSGAYGDRADVVDQQHFGRELGLGEVLHQHRRAAADGEEDMAILLGGDRHQLVERLVPPVPQVEIVLGREVLDDDMAATREENIPAGSADQRVPDVTGDDVVAVAAAQALVSGAPLQ